MIGIGLAGDVMLGRLVDHCILADPELDPACIYRDRPILYSTGDFVDDYAVDPDERNDLSCFFEVIADLPRVVRIILHPVRIGGCRVSVASGADAEWMKRWVVPRAAVLGTTLRPDGNDLVAEISA